MKIMHHFISTSRDHELANGIVTIVRPLGPREADISHGPVYLCRCVFGEFVAFYHELDFEDSQSSDAEYPRAGEDAERRRDAADGFGEEA